MLLALIQVGLLVLTMLWWIIIIQAILSWLVAFNVINTHNDFVRQLYYALDKLTEPLYRPFRKVMPDFGGIDFSPLVVLLIIFFFDSLLRQAAVNVMSGY